MGGMLLDGIPLTEDFMGYVIFDLDGTVIDTSHRYRNNAEGHCDLEYWFANSTPEMIAKDRLLPLAQSWRTLSAAGHSIIVCTARDFTPLNGVPLGDIYCEYLEANGLYYDHLLHRCMVGPDHETYGDGALKIKLLNDLAIQLGFTCIGDMRAVMFDDNLGVIETLVRHGVTMFDATAENARLAA